MIKDTFFKEAFQQLDDAALIVNGEGVIQYVNQSFYQMSGYEPEEIVEQNVICLFKQSIQLLTSWQGEVEIQLKNNLQHTKWLSINPIRNQFQTVDHTVLILTALQNSSIDPLTKLPNRYLLQKQLTEIIKTSQKQDLLFAVLYLDLDRFKFVNDTLGHSYGDLLLQKASERLKATIGESNLLARMGGDEFVCILQKLRNEEDAEKIAKQIVINFSEPFTLHDIEIHISTSIGISLFPYDGDDEEVLLTNADSAMYRAKKKGRNQYELAKVEVNAGGFERLLIENYLRKALENNELSLNFQPQYNLQKERITGFEALLRWNQPVLGNIPPIEFIPIAEETGLILPIGDWVLKKACLKIKEMEREGYHSLRVAVNLSAQQFLQKNLVEKINNVLEETSIHPGCLELEITEGVVIHDIESTVSVLQQLKDIGIQISIDDFGTGYSSLNYLKKLPVHTLKIDRSFIYDIDTNPSSKALTTAITTMAHDLQLHVIAEGVETYKQLSYVKKSSCDAIQGYYFSKPLQEEDVIQFLTNTKQVVQKHA